jgi:hypothetical protein
VHLSVIDDAANRAPEREVLKARTNGDNALDGRTRSAFGQRGGPLGAVDAGSDITAYSLDWKAKFARWHLVPSKELLVSINDARNATWVRSNRLTGSSDGQEPERTLRRCQILASRGLRHGLEQS